MSKGAEDPTRLALAHAQGALADAARLLKRCPDTDGMVERLRQLGKELGARLDGMPLQSALQLQAGKEAPKRPSWLAAELKWREEEVVRVHLLAFRQWRQRANGVAPKNGHSLPEPVRRLIREALPIYDGNLLSPSQRAEWAKESRVRAAGIGIFYDPWMTGEFPESEGRPAGWSGPYCVEHDRPWRPMRGKPDPIVRFSERYYEAADLAEKP
jgi:hypothetical protein